MFLFEKDGSLNLTLKGNYPVENPDVIIKGYTTGAALIVNGTTYGVKDGEELGRKAKLFVYQKDDKLALTFRGIEGMNNPELTFDQISDSVTSVIVNGDSLLLDITSDKIEVTTSSAPSGETQQPEINEDEPEDDEVIIPDVTENSVEKDILEPEEL